MVRLVLLHASTGAALGALLSLWLPAFDPVVVGSLSTWFAVGSGISAFILLNIESAQAGNSGA
jgi:hypothetical protein